MTDANDGARYCPVYEIAPNRCHDVRDPNGAVINVTEHRYEQGCPSGEGAKRELRSLPCSTGYERRAGIAESSVSGEISRRMNSSSGLLGQCSGADVARWKGSPGARHAILATMDPDDLRLLETVGAEAEVAAGYVLIERGQHGAGLYVILEGTVVVEAPEGSRELGPGALIGERALLSADGTRTARVRTTSDVRVLAVDRIEIERLCADNAAFARRLTDAGG